MRDFKQDLALSNVEEDRVRGFLSRYFNAKCYDTYSNDFYAIILGRLNIDYFLVREDSIITVEKKVRNGKYYLDSLAVEIEIISNDNVRIGNLFTTKADYMLYLWQVDNELLSQGLMVRLDKFREWFRENCNRYRDIDTVPTRYTKGNKTYTWHAKIKVIPLIDILMHDWIERINVW